MKALVTGGCGFIGSHLVERLLQEGYEVTVVDNLRTGRRANLKEALGHPSFRLVEDDVTQENQIKDYFEGIDVVFHLAALADIIPSIQRPMEYYQTNVTGTISVLEAARSSGVKRFIYAASSSCYGIPDRYPTSESSPIKPEYPYALTKYLGEQLVLHWGQVYKIDAVSLRLFNVYGPRCRTNGTYGAVMGVFLAQKLADRPLTIVGDGTQTRDFTYVADVVEAFWLACHSNLHHEILNVGSGGTYSVDRLARLIGGPTVHIPKRPGEPDCTFADITKIRSLLGFSPRVSFESGVKKMLARIAEWSGAPVWTPESIASATREWFHCLTVS